MFGLLTLCALTTLLPWCRSVELINKAPACDGISEFQRTKLRKLLDTYPENFTKELPIFTSNSSVCALRWVDRALQQYDLKTCTDVQAAAQEGFQPTHRGKCGGCSTLKALAMYQNIDMTSPVRMCGLKGFYSSKVEVRCMQNIGFADKCLEAWLWNLRNTSEKCRGICLKHIFSRNNKDGGSDLNPCIQCDEDESGPQFKYMSGRTRRNSGIKSEIMRGTGETAQLEEFNHHCY